MWTDGGGEKKGTFVFGNGEGKSFSKEMMKKERAPACEGACNREDPTWGGGRFG